MRKLIFVIALALAAAPALADTYTVGQRVITDGDSVAKLIETIGQPDRIVELQNKYGAAVGERWDYYRDGKTVQFTVSGGRILSITEIR